MVSVSAGRLERTTRHTELARHEFEPRAFRRFAVPSGLIEPAFLQFAELSGCTFWKPPLQGTDRTGRGATSSVVFRPAALGVD